MPTQSKPPLLADRLLEWFCAPHLLEYIQGDLHEEFEYQVKRIGEHRAKWFYWWEVLGFIKPRYIKRKPSKYPKTYLYSPTMLRNYFKIALRNLLKHKGYSFINIFGLATGMAVAMLIGLWIYDELSYNKSFQNYERIAQVMQHQTFDGEINTQTANPYLMGDEIRAQYGSDFKYIVMSSWTGEHLLTFEEKKLTKTGNYFEPAITEMLSLKMLKGTRSGLKFCFRNRQPKRISARLIPLVRS